MRAFWLIAYRSLMRRKGRAFLTSAGIMLGVALLFASLVNSASSTRALERYVNELSGKADVVASPLGAVDASLPIELVSKIQKLPEVRNVVPVVGFPTVVESAHSKTKLEINQDSEVVIVGAPSPGVTQLYSFKLQSGRLPSDGSNEVVLPARLSRTLKVKTGDSVQVAIPFGRSDAVVSGVLADEGAGRLNNGGVAFTSLTKAQTWIGKSASVNQIYVVLAGNTDPQRWAKANKKSIGPGIAVEPVSETLDFARQQLQGISGTLTALAAAVLFIAGFLIYLTLSTAVAERIKVHGTMQALGAKPRQIGSLVVAEAIVISIPAGIVGLGLGLLFARLGLELSGRFLGEFGTTIVVPPRTIAIALAMGVVVTVFSALVPARRAAKMDPVEAMRGDYATERRLSRGWILGLLLFAMGLALGWKTSSANRVGASTLLITFASVLLVPPILRPAARLLGVATEKLSRGVGRIAVLHLARERTRSAYTLALVMIVMALILATAATDSSFRASFDRLLGEQFGADFELRAASTFTDDFRERLEAIPGVESTTPVSIGLSRLLTSGGEERVLLSFVDPASYFRVSSFSFIKGDKLSAQKALSSGGKVVFPMATAERLGLDIGDEITLMSASGEKKFEIASLIRSPNSLTTMFLGAADGRTHFNLDRPIGLQVKVEPGTKADPVIEVVKKELSKEAEFLVETPAAIKEDVRAQIASGINGFFALLIVAAGVGFVGLANTLAVSILQRYREIGLIRATGARRLQVAGGTFVESATLVGSALILAIPLGSLLAWLLVSLGARIVGDLTVDFSYPWAVLPWLAAGGVLMSVIASIGPARRAAKLEPDVALRYE